MASIEVSLFPNFFFYVSEGWQLGAEGARKGGGSGEGRRQGWGGRGGEETEEERELDFQWR